MAPIMLFTHPPPALASVASRTDCNIDDDAAGMARERFLQAGINRRAQENARISLANQANKQKLLAISSKTDDGDDGAVQSPASAAVKLRLDGMRDFREMWVEQSWQRFFQDRSTHREKLTNAKPTIDDDTEDDATGEARARLKAESAARKEAEAEALRASNREYFARINSVSTLTDSKIWDDGEGSAGAARAIVARESAARKKEEARMLALSNKEAQLKLSQVKAKTDDGD